jgi:hypothetical protein
VLATGSIYLVGDLLDQLDSRGAVTAPQTRGESSAR